MGKKESLNTTLQRANIAKNDEFYTQLTDIEKELRHYKHHFKDKIVFCNCDDPFESNFFKYFALNFNHLKLKKLICTCYAGSTISGEQLSLFDVEPLKDTIDEEKKPYKVIINEVEDLNNDGIIDLVDVETLLKNKKNVLTLLEGSGDFRSIECIELLKQADIVVTNPPFSLFRDFVIQLIENDKKFIILGNQNAIAYNEIFQLLKDNKIWLGVDNNGTKWFQVPDDYDIKTESRKKIVNGKKFFSMGNIVWFTNLDIQKRHNELILYKKYYGNESEYQKYDNYDAININSYVDIPDDYFGEMGVPVTFLDKHNPKQFDLIGKMTTTKIDDYNFGYPYINGRKKFARIIIKRK
jgi:hypothetical protein